MNTRPTRNRFKFTLRALLVAVLVIAAYSAGWRNSQMYRDSEVMDAAHLMAEEILAAKHRNETQMFEAYVERVKEQEVRQVQMDTDKIRSGEWIVIQPLPPLSRQPN